MQTTVAPILRADAALSEGPAAEVPALALEGSSSDADEFSPDEDLPAKIGRWFVEAAVVGLVILMGAEMLVRSAFGWSIQFSNEIGGYALLAITFLSMASGQLLHAYHRVHFIEHRLSPAGRARLRLAFDLVAAAAAVVLLAALIRFEWITWNSGDVAATSLLTPLWIPRLAMPLGLLNLSWALLRTLVGDWRRLRAASR